MNGDSVSPSAPLESSQMETPQDLFSQEPPDLLQQPPDSDVPFSPTLIEQLPNMSVEEITKLEILISREFSALSRDYLEARKSRIDSLLKSVNAQIKIIQGHDAEWTDLYLNQLAALEDYIAYPEALVQHSKRFKELLGSVKLPWELDDLFHSRGDQLPFAKYFQQIILPYQKELMALDNQRNYSSALVDQLAEKNHFILWNQYRADIVEYKEKLVRQTYAELAELHEEYYGINSNEMLVRGNKSYYRSVVPVSGSDLNESTQMRLAPTNIDSFSDIENRYHKKNKIEITSSKYDALERLRVFNTEQGKHAIPQVYDATVKLVGCLGLTEEDISADLALISSQTRVLKENLQRNSGSNSENGEEKIKEAKGPLLYKDVINMNKKESTIEFIPFNIPLSSEQDNKPTDLSI